MAKTLKEAIKVFDFSGDILNVFSKTLVFIQYSDRNSGVVLPLICH